ANPVIIEPDQVGVAQSLAKIDHRAALPTSTLSQATANHLDLAVAALARCTLRRRSYCPALPLVLASIVVREGDHAPSLTIGGSQAEAPRPALLPPSVFAPKGRTGGREQMPSGDRSSARGVS